MAVNKILIVEDDPVHQQRLREVLQGASKNPAARRLNS